TELLAYFQAVVGGAREDHRVGTKRLLDRHRHQTNRAWAGNPNALTSDKTAEFRQRIHRRAGGDDESALFIGHLVRNRYKRVDGVDLVFAETAVGGEPIGAVALVYIAVIEPIVVARRVHALAAPFALSAT